MVSSLRFVNRRNPLQRPTFRLWGVSGLLAVTGHFGRLVCRILCRIESHFSLSQDFLGRRLCIEPAGDRPNCLPPIPAPWSATRRDGLGWTVPCPPVRTDAAQSRSRNGMLFARQTRHDRTEADDASSADVQDGLRIQGSGCESRFRARIGGTNRDRVAPGGCPPGAPTDPNVRN